MGGGSEVTNNPDNANPETETPDTESPDEIDPEGETPDGQNKVKYCKIKFSSEGFPTGTTMSGSTTTSVRNGKYFSTVKKPTVTCPKGYKCSGWSEDAPTEETRTLIKDNDKIESDKTLYGVFEQVTTTHTVTLFAGDGSWATSGKILTVKDVADGTTLAEVAKKETLNPSGDEEFENWYDANGNVAEGTTEITADVAYFAKYVNNFAPALEGYPSAIGVKAIEDNCKIYLYRKSSSAKNNIQYFVSTSNKSKPESDDDWNSLASTSSTTTVPSTALTINKGEYIYLRANNSTGLNTSSSVYCTLKFTKKCCLNGSVLGLLDNGLETLTAIPSDATYCFYELFYGQKNIQKVSKKFLPSTTLSNNCYRSMFRGCTSLTAAPELPATELAISCYTEMFYNCDSLTTAPVLPAETLSSNCYDSMFYNCDSLTTAPALPVKSLSNNCYRSMFRGCTSLTTAPELPATELATSCYYNMFAWCTSLTTAPELPATTLAESCYDSMFYNCTSLTELPINKGQKYYLQATTLTKKCYQFMFSGCTSLTTAPALPAETLENYCYCGMFAGCESLNVLECSKDNNYLIATTTSACCYMSMFLGCTKLTEINFIIPKSIQDGMFSDMFYNCSSLTKVNGYEINENWFINMDFWDGTHYFSAGWCTGMFGGDLIEDGSSQGPYKKTIPFTLPIPWDESTQTGYKLQLCCFSGLNGNYKNINFASQSDADSYLPWKTLAQYCYASMFSGCTSLTIAPALPSTTLATSCYSCMFSGCTSLTTAPELPSTTLTTSCYSTMFSDCSSLETAPELPATTLADGCYGQMFLNCTSLSTTPKLDVYTLPSSSYYRMFEGCTSLTTIGEIKATSGEAECCSKMFYGCSALHVVTFENIPSEKTYGKIICWSDSPLYAANIFYNTAEFSSAYIDQNVTYYWYIPEP